MFLFFEFSAAMGGWTCWLYEKANVESNISLLPLHHFQLSWPSTLESVLTDRHSEYFHAINIQMIVNEFSNLLSAGENGSLLIWTIIFIFLKVELASLPATSYEHSTLIIQTRFLKCYAVLLTQWIWSTVVPGGYHKGRWLLPLPHSHKKRNGFRTQSEAFCWSLNVFSFLPISS